MEDLIKIIRAHPLYDHLEMVSEEEVTKLKKHYNHFMYQARDIFPPKARSLHNRNERPNTFSLRLHNFFSVVSCGNACELMKGKTFNLQNLKNCQKHVSVPLLFPRSGYHSLPFFSSVDDTMQALLHCAKNSMNMLKNRIQSRSGGTGAFLFVQKPFFEVRLFLACGLLLKSSRKYSTRLANNTKRPWWKTQV